MTNSLWTPAAGLPPEQDDHGASDFLVGDDQGGQRVTGCLPKAHAKVQGRLPVYDAREDITVMGSDSWVSQDWLAMRQMEPFDINQNGFPACCLASLAYAVAFLAAIDHKPVPRVDWEAAWRTLSGGRGGVALYDAIDYAMETGLPLQGGGVVKVAEAWDCNSIEGLATGLQKGCITTFGHDQHAECAPSLVFENRAWYLDTRNTWGRDWGDNGWHKFPLKKVEIRTYGAILLRELRYFPTDVVDFQ